MKIIIRHSSIAGAIWAMFWYLSVVVRVFIVKYWIYRNRKKYMFHGCKIMYTWFEISFTENKHMLTFVVEGNSGHLYCITFAWIRYKSENNSEHKYMQEYMYVFLQNVMSCWFIYRSVINCTCILQWLHKINPVRIMRAKITTGVFIFILWVAIWVPCRTLFCSGYCTWSVCYIPIINFDCFKAPDTFSME